MTDTLRDMQRSIVSPPPGLIRMNRSDTKLWVHEYKDSKGKNTTDSSRPTEEEIHKERYNSKDTLQKKTTEEGVGNLASENGIKKGRVLFELQGQLKNKFLEGNYSLKAQQVSALGIYLTKKSV
ncbi:hypothetical protein PIB30_046979 [Stylosanthes scabra]|uniref:Uncharacterized protein n=1 Tax=Stylosanthes scabra TaxID=79078 RepID=A0ABU6UJX0_9FABA|nr:hypothetical protein [Stylosanthes scabra]